MRRLQVVIRAIGCIDLLGLFGLLLWIVADIQGQAEALQQDGTSPTWPNDLIHGAAGMAFLILAGVATVMWVADWLINRYYQIENTSSD